MARIIIYFCFSDSTGRPLYISGHAGWRHESKLAVAWATVGTDLLKRKSADNSHRFCCLYDIDDCTLELDDPVPNPTCIDSYWLMIHVVAIVEVMVHLHWADSRIHAMILMILITKNTQNELINNH